MNKRAIKLYADPGLCPTLDDLNAIALVASVCELYE
jgi:hypothetical protein